MKMAHQQATLAVRLPADLAAELEQLTRGTGCSKSYYARQAIIEVLEDRADYLRGVAVLEQEKGQPNLTLEQAKKELGLDIEFRPNARADLRKLDPPV